MVFQGGPSNVSLDRATAKVISGLHDVRFSFFFLLRSILFPSPWAIPFFYKNIPVDPPEEHTALQSRTNHFSFLLLMNCFFSCLLPMSLFPFFLLQGGVFPLLCPSTPTFECTVISTPSVLFNNFPLFLIRHLRFYHTLLTSIRIPFIADGIHLFEAIKSFFPKKKSGNFLSPSPLLILLFFNSPFPSTFILSLYVPL